MNNTLLQNSFGVLTFIVAPAILTNATSVLAMSTINRMLRTRERMHQLFAESEDETCTRGPEFLAQVNRAEEQGILLLRALHWIYVSLSAFAASALVTLLGAVSGQLLDYQGLHLAIVIVALLLGVTGVTGLVCGCLNLVRATRLSMANISEEAAAIRARQARRDRGPARAAGEPLPPST